MGQFRDILDGPSIKSESEISKTNQMMSLKIPHCMKDKKQKFYNVHRKEQKIMGKICKLSSYFTKVT